MVIVQRSIGKFRLILYSFIIDGRNFLCINASGYCYPRTRHYNKAAVDATWNMNVAIQTSNSKVYLKLCIVEYKFYINNML